MLNDEWCSRGCDTENGREEERLKSEGVLGRVQTRHCRRADELTSTFLQSDLEGSGVGAENMVSLGRRSEVWVR